MTPISIMRDGRKVVRTSSVKATPFLRSLEGDIYADVVCEVRRNLNSGHPKALDIGCGNGRNSEWARDNGFEIKAFDQHPDYPNAIRWDFAVMPLPLYKHSVHLVLLQYVLMFLQPSVRQKVAYEALQLCACPGVVVVELQDVKTGMMRKADISEFLAWFEAEAKCVGMTVLKRSAGKIAVMSNHA